MTTVLILTFFILAASVVIYSICTINFLSKCREPRNKVHFYVTKDARGVLLLWLGKPKKSNNVYWGVSGKSLWIAGENKFESFNLNKDDFANMKESIVEVFLDMNSKSKHYGK